MTDAVFHAEFPQGASARASFHSPSVANFLNRNPISEVDMAARNSEAVTWPQVTRIAAVVAFFLVAITWFASRELDGVKTEIKSNTSAINSLSVETNRGMASIREQLVETNTSLKNLIVETRQNKPR